MATCSHEARASHQWPIRSKAWSFIPVRYSMAPDSPPNHRRLAIAVIAPPPAAAGPPGPDAAAR